MPIAFGINGKTASVDVDPSIPILWVDRATFQISISNYRYPTPVGGIGVLAVVLTIANRIFELTGKRLRHLLMSVESVKVVLSQIFKERRQKL